MTGREKHLHCKKTSIIGARGKERCRNEILRCLLYYSFFSIFKKYLAFKFLAVRAKELRYPSKEEVRI